MKIVKHSSRVLLTLGLLFLLDIKQFATVQGQNVRNNGSEISDPVEIESVEGNSTAPTPTIDIENESSDNETDSSEEKGSTIVESFEEIFHTEKGENVELEIVERDVETPGWLELPQGYKNDQIPKAYHKGKKDPFKINIYIYIRGVNSIDIRTGTIILDIDLFSFWRDERFHFNHTSSTNETTMVNATTGIRTKKRVVIETEKLHQDFAKQIWTPDIIIENTVLIPHNDLTSESLISFNSLTGFVKLKRLEVKSPCHMDFFYYPMDTQKCEFTLRSYKYLSRDLKLFWVDNDRGLFMAKSENTNYEIKVDKPTRFKRKENENVRFPNLIDPANVELVNPQNKTHDVLKFVISFRRNTSFHLSQTYLPTWFFILITWLLFLLPPSLAASRIAATLTTLLTINTMFTSVRNNSPQGATVKAIDIWMVICMMFAFLPLVLFASMAWLEAVKDREEKRQKEFKEQAKKNKDLEVFEAATEGSFDKRSKQALNMEATFTPTIKMMPTKTLQRVLKVRKLLQKFGLNALIATFVAFNAMYWSWLCTGSGHFAWTVDHDYNEMV